MDIKIDKNKVKRIRNRVYSREILNIKKPDAKKKKDSEMVEELKKVIKDVVDKCY